MQPVDIVGRIEASLLGAGFTVTRDSVAGRQAVIGRTTRLGRGGRRRVFVLVAVFKAGMAGREHLDRFLDEAGQYAATVKGGLTTGAVAVAVAVVEGGDGPTEGAAAWARTAPGRPAAGRAPAFPVLVDAGAGRVDYPVEPEALARLAQEHVGLSVHTS